MAEGMSGFSNKKGRIRIRHSTAKELEVSWFTLVVKPVVVLCK